MTPLFLGLPEVKSPWVLWFLLLVPVLLVSYIWALHRSRSTAMRFTNTAILGAVMSKQPQWKRHIAVAAALLCVATTTVAWARPMGTEQVPRDRATIVVAIDSSLSMKADDVSPNRLAAAKAKAKDFITSLPTGFNVAVVSISEHPEIRMPPSTDRPTVLRAVDGIELQDGTALGGAIDKSLEAVKMAPGESKDPAPAAIVMLSDGDNTQGVGFLRLLLCRRLWAGHLVRGGEMAMMTLIAFGRPGRLWWLLVPGIFLAVYLVVVMWRRQPHEGPNELKRFLPSSRPWKQHLAMGLSVLSMATMVLAFAQPKAYHDVPRDRATVVVAIDVSRSMVATDVEPSRLSAAKTAAKDFLGDLPPRFNVSLVKFAASAQVVVPPTTDRAAVSTAIANLQVLPSTAIGEGIYSSLNALKLVPDDPKHPREKPPAAIVLLSDGATNVGRPSLEAAKEAGRQHVPVYTIAYGTAGGYVVEGGQRQPVPVNHYELAAVAKASGGEKFSAESLGQLSDVYKSIAQSVGYEKVFGEVTDKYVGVALALMVLTAASVITLCARWP